MRDWILCATVGAGAVLAGLRYLELSVFEEIPPFRALLAPYVRRGEVLVVPGGGLTDAGEPHPKLKGSIGEGSNHSNFSHQSSVNIVSEFRKFAKIHQKSKNFKKV